jgi:hypothetical protein
LLFDIDRIEAACHEMGPANLRFEGRKARRKLRSQTRTSWLPPEPGMGVCDGLVHGAAQLRRGGKDVVLADEREHPGPGQLLDESRFDADQHQLAVASLGASA